MKIEKIDGNKIKITLSIDELKERQVDIKDLKQNASRAQEFLWELIAEANIENELEIDEAQLLVEAYASNDSNFVITITKLNSHNSSIGDLYNSFSLKDPGSLSITKKTTLKAKNKNISCFVFKNFDLFLNAAKMIIENKLYIGKNSLYKYNNKFYLIFSRTTSRFKKFSSCYQILSEYGEISKGSWLFEAMIKEKGKLVFETNAIQELSKY